MTLQQLRARWNEERGAQRAVRESITSTQSVLDKLRAEALVIEETGLVLQTVGQATQEQLGIKLEDVVTMGLETVFPDDTDWRFKADFVQRRGQTEVDLLLADSQGNRIRPSDQDGGGLVDVVAFVLRVALWSLSRETRPTIILDEPWRNLHSREYHSRVARLVKVLSEKLGLQFIIITGEDEGPELLAGADRVITVRKARGVSQVEWRDN